MNSFTIGEALRLLKRNGITFHFQGDESFLVTHARRYEDADDSCVSFNRNLHVQLPARLPDAFLILREECHTEEKTRGHLLFVENPDLCFCLIGSLLNQKKPTFIHDSAVISKHARIGKNVSVDPFTYIGDDVQLGDEVFIGSGCFIDNADIGKNTRIHPGVKIGSPGLGSHKDSFGKWHDFPHFGRVIIGENVVIQDNVVINRGTLNETVISEGVRIGPISWIAHGVHIGRNALISQAVTIAGSVTIGDQSIIWGNASIREGVNIGSGSVVGLGSVVVKNIPNNEIWVGNPAKKMRDAK